LKKPVITVDDIQNAFRNDSSMSPEEIANELKDGVVIQCAENQELIVTPDVIETARLAWQHNPDMKELERLARTLPRRWKIAGKGHASRQFMDDLMWDTCLWHVAKQ
jgi:hypothetical protein